MSDATPVTALGIDVPTEYGLNGGRWARWVIPPHPGEGPLDSPC